MVFEVDEASVLEAREYSIGGCFALLLGSVEELSKVDELYRSEMRSSRRIVF